MHPTPLKQKAWYGRWPGRKILTAAISLASMPFLSLTPVDGSNHRSDAISPGMPGARREHTALQAEAIDRRCKLSAKGLRRDILELGLAGFNRLAAQGKVSRDSILTIVDFSQPSLEQRMYVIDLRRSQLLFQTVVSHGRNSGKEYARSFSNQHKSYQSSIGFYVTCGTYQGGNGYSLQLEGCEKGFNDNAKARAIVLHGADYAEVSTANLQRGYLGRSYGCPAVPMSIHRALIDRIKLGNALFIYSPDAGYLRSSPILNGMS